MFDLAYVEGLLLIELAVPWDYVMKFCRNHGYSSSTCLGFWFQLLVVLLLN